MKTLANIIIESHLDTRMQRLLYEACCLLEATNINKDYLLRVAGSPEKLSEAKGRVDSAWEDAALAALMPAKLNQKVLNFTYLMEIERPGFTDAEYISHVHDLAVSRSLEQRFVSKVNSDTVPEQAKAIIADANRDAVQSAKAYPGLTPEQERIWNRVKVYHEFPDGFRWVYAVDDNGCKVGNMPSDITGITMHHCGNEPDKDPNHEYWELRDSRGKAYLTVILNENGGIEESKSWGNQLNKYSDLIRPHVKWLLKDRQVTGVGLRYDDGYAPYMNFGVKDFLGKDEEFVDYVLENKPSLLGKAESRILFLKGAISEGILTVQDLKTAFAEDFNIHDLQRMVPALEEYEERARFKRPVDEKGCSPDSIFGYNEFSVLCSACDGNPFTEDEIISLIRNNRLSLEVFASYDVHLLTDRVQDAFVQTDHNHNFNVLLQIAEQVAAFTLSPTIVNSLFPPDDIGEDADFKNIGDRLNTLLNYLVTSNPPSKVDKYVERLFTEDKYIAVLDDVLASTVRKYGWSLDAMDCLVRCVELLGRNRVSGRAELARHFAEKYASLGVTERHDDMDDMVKLIASVGRSGDDELLNGLGAGFPDEFLLAAVKDIDKKTDYGNIQYLVATIVRMRGDEFFRRDVIADSLDDFRITWALLNMGSGSFNNAEMVFKTGQLACSTVNGGTWNVPSKYRDGAMVVFLQVIGKYPDVIPMLCNDDVFEFITAIEKICYSEHIDEIKTAGLNTVQVENVIDSIVGTVDIDVDSDDTGRYSRGKSRPGCSDWRSLGYALCYLARLYSIRPDALVNRCQEMLPYMISHELNVPGAWYFCEVPFEQWEAAFARWGYDFLKFYVFLMPDDQFNESEFISDFVVNKLANADKANGDIVDTIDTIRYSVGPEKMRRVAKVISYKIIKDQLPMDERRFNDLYRLKMISAEAYRAYMSRIKESTGQNVSIESVEDAENTLKMLKSMTKYEGMPDIIEATLKFLMDGIYENLGVGKYTWKVDEECGRYVNMVDSILSRLLAKPTTGMIPYALKRLFDDGIYARIRDFRRANWDACRIPGEPTSRLKCDAEEVMAELAAKMQDVQDAVKQLGAKKRAARKQPATP